MALKHIIKRDGTKAKFDATKLTRAIDKAVAETKEFNPKESKRLTSIATTILEKTNGKHIHQVEHIQDVVEQVLMAAGYYETAKAYILYRARQSKVRQAIEHMGITDDLGLSLNQLKVIEKRYLLHDEEGKVIETPSQWLTRVAKTLAKVEKKEVRKKWQDEFYAIMANFEFLPAGRTLNNAGTKQNQLANCFVLPVEDSIEGIFDAIKWTAIVHQSGGGTGFNFSKLRPNGDSVTKSAGGFATGPVSFMKIFDVATRQVMQGGKKRGANMGILNVDHPDIMEFITCKTEDGEIANFNISVGITDEFMKAVRDDKDFHLKNQRTGEVVHTIKARMLMDQIVALAWRTGDPGLINLDAINRNNPLLETYGPINATNPCGEQPLHPFDACNLGSINLAKFTTKDKKPQIDWPRLEKVTATAVRMLDNVIDACTYPLPQIRDTVRANRRIGLGVMGWADLLYELNIPYNSDQAVKLAKKVMKTIQDASWSASSKLAKEKTPFPRWQESSFAKGWDPLKYKQSKIKTKVRNMAITTIAPTGSISMAANTSSGIEPVFALSFVKNVVDDAGLQYVNASFRKALDELSLTDSQKAAIIDQVAKEGTVQHVKELSQEIKNIFVTAHDVDWQWHVKMQAAFQAHTDNAVSKTINFPANASLEDVKGAYLMAWEMGCKGITVYRDSSKSYQVLSHTSNTGTKEDQSKYLIQSKVKTKTLKERQREGVQLGEICPECSSQLAMEEGCTKCYSCGYSKCSI